ncbi:glycosyltransferase 87 family protein [Luedemannella helvata]|uniref:Glycosyltransferase 87 family protein n=1 Tax=Luedemannella helvata TaxID=349315 RepID=A0ABP4WSW5_9ACTN
MAWRRVTAVVGLALIAGAFAAVASARHGFFDLRVYYGAINYWVSGQGPLYDFVVPNSYYGFTYPPFAALVMSPMALLSLTATQVVSVTATVPATLLVLWWLLSPTVRREGWTPWYALGLAAALTIAVEPVRETVNFGQVNLLLLALVGADLLLGVARGRRWAGVGIGLATAIKLTPGIFIVYLLVTKRWRAAIVAAATAAGATVLAAVVTPDMSMVFWTEALWNTDRVGDLAFISNQSLQGAVARLNPDHPSTALWGLLVLACLAVWAVRCRRAVAAGDELTGFALTGVLGCLISPVTWVHHLVWLGPALVLLIDRAAAATTTRRRAGLLAFFGAVYVLLCSRLVWEFSDAYDTPVGWLLSNAYVWASLALLVGLPVRATAERVADIEVLEPVVARPRTVAQRP